jgi:hypothetical protein
MNDHPDYREGIRRGAEALAREIDREVLESLKKFDWEETVKNLNDPLRNQKKKNLGTTEGNRVSTEDSSRK